MLTTPNRFTRTSPNLYWNPGNGVPDAVSFTVDHSGVMVAGVSVYGGVGTYEYEVELLEEVIKPLYILDLLQIILEMSGHIFHDKIM